MPSSSASTVLIVDASAVARLVVVRALGPEVEVVQARSMDEALGMLTPQVGLVVTALRLPGGSGQALAETIRNTPGHNHTPILVVSGDTREALVGQLLGRNVTDYFDKGEGMEALSMFLKAHREPDVSMEGRILHVEDSRSVAKIVANKLEDRGLTVLQARSAEDAIAMIQAQMVQSDAPKMEMLLCDHFLIGEKTGLDVVREIRRFDHPVSRLPIIVTTGEENPLLQQEILSAGADDLLEKPMREAQMVAKIRYHLWRSHRSMPAPTPVDAAGRIGVY